ncbi:MAG TPA: hypothetical protein VL200_14495 [Lacunisphaera sp.]|jgi:hypothetical protein|nr:hypothetical protein [Lacunisphaera sp.]
MNKWPRILKVVGSVLIVVGSLDPMEGSVLIAPGSVLVAGGTWWGHEDPKVVREWRWLAIFICFGVLQLWELSAFGGFGDDRHSWWWGLLILPYVGGWILALARTLSNAFHGLKSLWRHDRPVPPNVTAL